METESNTNIVDMKTTMERKFPKLDLYTFKMGGIKPFIGYHRLERNIFYLDKIIFISKMNRNNMNIDSTIHSMEHRPNRTVNVSHMTDRSKDYLEWKSLSPEEINLICESFKQSKKLRPL